MKFDVQVQALKAFAAASAFGKNPVGSDDLAARMPVSAATAGLNNNFFTESGLITRASKGKYLPSDVACDFARRHGFDAKAAGHLLAETLRRTWFFDTVQQQMLLGPTSRNTLIEVLAHEAGATKDHEGHLSALLDWLEYAGLVVVQDDTVTLASAEGSVTPPGPDHGVPHREGTKSTGDGGKAPQGGAGEGPPALAFTFSLALTADDLAKLTPEQIEALFTAVGKAQAVKFTTKQ